MGIEAFTDGGHLAGDSRTNAYKRALDKGLSPKDARDEVWKEAEAEREKSSRK